MLATPLAANARPADAIVAANSADEGSVGRPERSNRNGEVGSPEWYVWCRNRFRGGIARRSRIDAVRAASYWRDAERAGPRLVRPAAPLIVLKERQVRQRVRR